MRTQQAIDRYIEKLEQAYLSNTETMTDVDLHNVNIRIRRAVALYSKGYQKEEIRRILSEEEKNPESTMKMDKFERARDDIQRDLIDRGYNKNSPEFERHENELMLKWIRRLKSQN